MREGAHPAVRMDPFEGAMAFLSRRPPVGQGRCRLVLCSERMIAPFNGSTPRIDASAFVVDSAIVVGDVTIGPDASIWFHAVLRGDVERIRIGARTNVQD